ncbi:amidohydrolase [Acidobacteria bacterium AH-259-L09]|nr:amidohydrolase [Acidobacteria bacterium AH-259-L09]
MSLRIMFSSAGFLFAVFLLVPSIRAQDVLEEMIGRELDALVSTYEYLHSHPELSYRERETSAYLANELRSLGYEVTEKVGQYDDPGRTSYGLVALMKNGQGPTVMVRTDLDALPVKENTGLAYANRMRVQNESGEEVGVMHACGHDVHMTTFLGTAKVLGQLKHRWKGTLVLIGQPAEERGAGARAMLKDGLYARFPRPDFVLALHTNAFMETGKIGYCPGYALANVDSVDITIRGSGGHGAYPHTTKDPVVLASQVVLALQTIVSREISPLDPAVVTVGSIHGGTKHNIIPDEAHLQLTVRSYKPEVRKRILDSIKRITQGIASAAGVPAERAPVVTVAEDEYTPATYNDPELIERLVPVLKEALGSDNVVRKDPVMGGEDFSRYSLEGHQIPICMLWLGAVDPAIVRQYQREGKTLPSLHSSQFTPLPEPAIKTGVKAMTTAVLELLGG